MHPVQLETGPRLHRAAQGLPEKFHVRLKQQGRTLVVLQGDTEQEAHERAQRLADALFSNQSGWTIEPA